MLLMHILIGFDLALALPTWPWRSSKSTHRSPTRKKQDLKKSYDRKPTGMFQETSTKDVPEWLVKLSGHKEWPGPEPPFISTVDLSEIPDIPMRKMENNCDLTVLTESSCAWDCDGCTDPSDIIDCEQYLAQTFDDGPNFETSYLLEISKNHPLTFFVLGANVVRFPEMFRQQVDDGHLLGTHTWSHEFLPSLTNQQIAAQIQWSIWAMNATGGIIPRYIRPPYGAVDNRVRAIARKFGLNVVLWSLDSQDWKINCNEIQKSEVLDTLKLWQAEERTGILLQHDLTLDAINVAKNASLFEKNATIAECANSPWYQ